MHIRHFHYIDQLFEKPIKLGKLFYSIGDIRFIYDIFNQDKTLTRQIWLRTQIKGKLMDVDPT